MAEAGNKVILVDCDIRRSVLINRYQVEEKVDGLSHFLAGRASLDDIVCRTNIPNLYIMFAGANVPNPAELLEGKRFSGMIESMKKIFDYVILDCPPLGVVIDAAIIGKYVDGAVIVIESNAVSYKVVQNVKSQMEKSGCRILGAVVNKAETKKKGGIGGYYGSYYGGYYGDYS
jgi:capsular exopolysaccharide synthesis family protein